MAVVAVVGADVVPKWKMHLERLFIRIGYPLPTYWWAYSQHSRRVILVWAHATLQHEPTPYHGRLLVRWICSTFLRNYWVDALRADFLFDSYFCIIIFRFGCATFACTERERLLQRIYQIMGPLFSLVLLCSWAVCTRIVCANDKC